MEVEGNAEFAAARYTAALKCYNKWLKANKQDDVGPHMYAQVLANRAAVFLAMEMWRKALKDCDEAINVYPHLQLAYLRKGLALRNLGKTDDAAAAFSEGASVFGDVDTQALLAGFAADINFVPFTEGLLTASEKAAAAAPAAAPAPQPTQTQPTSTKSEKKSKGKGRALALVDEDESSDEDNNKLVAGPVGASKTQQQITLAGSDDRVSDVLAESGYTMEEASREVAQRGLLENGSGVLSVDQEISKGYLCVNSGKFKQAVRVFDKLLKKDPRLVAAYLGRGTAYALMNKLENAVRDFGLATEIMPNLADAWKRRGQSLAALDRDAEALDNLNKAEKLSRDPEVYHQRGLIYHKLKNYELASRDFIKSIEMDENNKLTWNFLGLCHNALGNPREAIAAFAKAIKLDPTFREAYANTGQAYRDMGNAPQAFKTFTKILKVERDYAHAYHLRGLTRYGSGDIAGALHDMMSALAIQPNSLDVTHMKATCHHSLGMYADAVADYTRIVSVDPNHVAWYQRECAKYHASVLDKDIRSFNMDVDMDKHFKEAWCKRNSPATLLGYTPPPEIPRDFVAVGNPTLPAEATALLTLAATFEPGLQYNCYGFMRNMRQLRMGGLAILSLSQRLSALWSAVRANGGGLGELVSENPATVSGLAASGEDELHFFGWRDAFDVAVLWRQYSEPNDPVWWVDLLAPEQFAEGFGSQTPMVTGQSKVVRYYPVGYPRSFEFMLSLMPTQCNLSSRDASRVAKAKSIDDLYKIIGHDFYVVTPCHSFVREGKVMEGTRLTIQAKKPVGYEFSIRTPGTPPRWVEFDEELSAAWALLTEAASAESVDVEAVVEHVLTLIFYWYNFMPLSRGTAMCGLLMLHGVLLSVGYEITAPIPEGLQVDWEGILRPTPDDFKSAIKPWVWENLGQTDKAVGAANVAETFTTLRKMIEALNADVE